MKKRLLVIGISSLLALGAMSVVTSCDNDPVQTTKEEFQGEGEPSPSLGKDGDTYLDTTTNDVYVKENGKWVKQSTSKHLSGNGIPNDASGNDGDTFTDTSTGDEYEKRNGKWVLVKEGDLVAKHIVTFDLNGGKLNGSTIIDPVSVRHGEWVDEPIGQVTKQNATFKGWYDGEFKYNFHSPVMGDLTLVAMFEANEQAKVSFTVNPNNGSSAYTVDGLAGDQLRLTNPTKEGYEFVGWYIEETDEKVGSVITEDLNGMTLIAKFVKANFNFKLGLNDDGTYSILGINNIDSVSIVVPDEIDGIKITEIGDTAFQSRISLTDVTFGKNIRYISPKCFMGARALRSVFVVGGNMTYKDKDGILYSYDETEILFVPPKASMGTTFIIPEGVTKVGDYCFYGQTEEGATEVKFPETLIEIGNNAFYGCYAFTSLNLPTNLKKIGDYAFAMLGDAGCIEQVHFNDKLEYIGDCAFVGLYVKGALTLPSTVKHIGSRAFANATAITKFTFPRDLVELGENPLSNCTGVLNIALENGNTAFSIEDEILYSKNFKTLVLCPSGRRDPVTVHDGCEFIGDYAFYEVDDLEGITFPTSVIRFGNSAFEDCYHITSFTIPNTVIEIGEDCFDECEDLASITLGTGLRSIPRYAFWGCKSLSEINIPGNIETIDDFAFALTNNLSKITFNEGLTSIGDCAFMYNFYATEEYATDPGSKLTSLKFPNTLINLSSSAFSGHSGIRTIALGANMRNFPAEQFADSQIVGVTANNSNTMKVDNNMVLSKDGKTLYYATTLCAGDVTIPSGVETIEEYAFYRSSDLKKKLDEDGFSIDSITFASSVKDIKMGAFSGQKIGNVTFGSNLRRIEEGAFYSCEFNGIAFNNGIEYIGDSSFLFAEGIQNIVFPSSLKEIGDSAFALSDATNVVFNEGLETINNEAFDRAKVSGIVRLPTTLKNFGARVFWAGYLESENLVEDFDLTNNPYLVSENGLMMDAQKTKTIAYAAGYKNDGVNRQKTLVVPSSVTTIGVSSISYAPYLTNVELSEGLKTIEDQAFEGTGNLKNLIVPLSVEYVGYRAFNGWKMQTKITFRCSETYAATHFSPDYLNGVSTSMTEVVYNG